MAKKKSKSHHKPVHHAKHPLDSHVPQWVTYAVLVALALVAASFVSKVGSYNAMLGY